MKAYKGKDGKTRLFRPRDNMDRFNRSAERLCLPTFDSDILVRLIAKLVAIEASWIPEDYGTSLYIRPTMIGTGDSLGIHKATQATIFVICAPVRSHTPLTRSKSSSQILDVFILRKEHQPCTRNECLAT